MYKATPVIEKALKAAGLKCSSSSLPQFSYVEAGFTGDNTSFKVRFISPDNDNDVKVLTDNLAKCPENKRTAVLVALNDLNKKYKYAKFAMDADGDITAEYDFPVKTPDSAVGDIALEICVRFMKIVDEAFPVFMRPILF